MNADVIVPNILNLWFKFIYNSFQVTVNFYFMVTSELTCTGPVWKVGTYSVVLELDQRTCSKICESSVRLGSASPHAISPANTPIFWNQ